MRKVGWCEACRTMVAVDSLPDGILRCTNPKCGSEVLPCSNYVQYNACNRLVVVAAHADQSRLCGACALTSTIPDLSVTDNHQKWCRLEQAKRRLLYQLEYLRLPYNLPSFPLSFDFKGDILPDDGAWYSGEHSEKVYTGHFKGKITINIREADDVEREKTRVAMNEAQRTLIGHFHHEIGHYYWKVLVEGRHQDEFIKLFGNHQQPDYSTALAHYYEQGLPPDWQEAYISAYATSHPWEDFAETFGFYLDMRSILETANNFSIPLPYKPPTSSLTELLSSYRHIGITVNELNRCLGITDLVPEVIVPKVEEKLKFVDMLVSSPLDPERLN